MTADLRKLAEDAGAVADWYDVDDLVARGIFIAACSPSAILALLDAKEAAERALSELLAIVDDADDRGGELWRHENHVWANGRPNVDDNASANEANHLQRAAIERARAALAAREGKGASECPHGYPQTVRCSRCGE